MVILKTYKELKVWQKGYELALIIYKITKKFPKDETYGLVAQMRRASVSVPSNIAEGFTRQHTQEYIRFLYTAYGSLAELETQLMLSKDLTYTEEKSYEEIINILSEVERMLAGLIRVLKNKL